MGHRNKILKGSQFHEAHTNEGALSECKGPSCNGARKTFSPSLLFMRPQILSRHIHRHIESGLGEVLLQPVGHNKFVYNLTAILGVDTQVSFISMEKNHI